MNAKKRRVQLKRIKEVDNKQNIVKKEEKSNFKALRSKIKKRKKPILLIKKKVDYKNIKIKK